VAAHIEALSNRIVEWAEARADVRLVTPADPQRRAGVVSFAPVELEAMAARLTQAQVSFTVREGAIRLSPHLYNTREEIDAVLAVLER
jgi:selenocysteine lyase/cysteine desulfurase